MKNMTNEQLKEMYFMLYTLDRNEHRLEFHTAEQYYMALRIMVLWDGTIENCGRIPLDSFTI